jgi:hypothetical protein
LPPPHDNATRVIPADSGLHMPCNITPQIAENPISTSSFPALAEATPTAAMHTLLPIAALLSFAAAFPGVVIEREQLRPSYDYVIVGGGGYARAEGWWGGDECYF